MCDALSLEEGGGVLLDGRGCEVVATHLDVGSKGYEECPKCYRIIAILLFNGCGWGEVEIRGCRGCQEFIRIEIKLINTPIK